MNREVTCCFTGHRPKAFPWGSDSSDPRCAVLLSRISVAISDACEEGVRHFLAGNALGVDLWAAELVLQKKTEYPGITLEIALPFDGHNQNADGSDGLRIRAVQAAADLVHTVSCSRNYASAYCERNHYMVDHSGMLISVYDENSGLRGGTQQTLLYAREKGLLIIRIPWMDIR